MQGLTEARFKIQIAATLLSRTDRRALLTDAVGARGIDLRTDDPPQVMELVRVRLVLPPDHAEIVVHGMVTSVTRPGAEGDAGAAPGASMTFYAMDPDVAARWAAFLDFVRANHAEACDDVVRLADRDRATDAIRRRHPRRALAVRVDLATSDGVFALSSVDLSEGGAFLRTSAPRPVGERVALSLVNPRSKAHVFVMGVVRRVRAGEGGGMAVAFEDVSAEARAEIAALVELAAFAEDGVATVRPGDLAARLRASGRPASRRASTRPRVTLSSMPPSSV